MNIAFDTLAYTKHLRQAGFNEQQAEAHAEALAMAISDQIATKSDTEKLEHKMDTVIQKLEHKMDTVIQKLEHKMDTVIQRLEQKIEAVEYRITIKMGGMLAVAIGIIVALLKLL